MRRSFAPPLLSAVLCLAAFTTLAADAPRPRARAVRIEPGVIHLDGRLDETIWTTAPAVTELVQRDPKEGAPASDPVEIRFAFDDEALYVGARLFCTDKSLQALLGRRDDDAQSESLSVSLDTFLDRRTAATFGVTAAGARLDSLHGQDAYASDPDFNPVWEARTRVDEAGWTAELRVPFSQLRFNRQPALVFGLNLERYVPARNEDDYWVLIGKQDTGFVSHFGELHGIEGITPRRRLELLPYAAGGAAFTGDPEAGNPFDDGSRFEGRVGGDAKLGIGSNLTLDATLNPDFGQVEADPAVVNLSAFETIFDEKRPFFREGNSIFTSEWGNYFYSRRIGGSPRGEAAGDFVDYPRNTTILGAAKLSGRLPSGLSIGTLVALTGRESARSAELASGTITTTRVAPLAGYFVSRVQQEFGASGSTVGAMFSYVRRDLSAGEALASVLTRNALTAGLDWRLRFKGGNYELTGYAGLSHVDGESAAITALQEASARYFQRPDADYVELDPARTSLDGGSWRVRGAKNSGRWLWAASLAAESPELELNDAGRVITADGRTWEGNLTYRQTKPGRLFHAWQLRLGSAAEWNFGGDRQASGIRPVLILTWKNFHRTILSGFYDLAAQDERRTRGGPSMGTPPTWGGFLNHGSSSTARTRWNVGAGLVRDDDGQRGWDAGVGYSYRAGPRLQFSIDPYYSRSTSPRQYVTTIEGGRPETYGDRYVFSFIEQTTLSTPLRLSYTFTPDLTLDLYAEPFAASGRYYDHGELLQPRGRALRTYGTDGTAIATQADGSLLVTDGATSFALDNLDFRVRSFRSNLVLRWEWRRGSSLYAVWQRDRFGDEGRGPTVGPHDLLRSFGAPGGNLFLIKASFWLGL